MDRKPETLTFFAENVMKTCGECNIQKSTLEFSQDKRRLDTPSKGYRRICKECEYKKRREAYRGWTDGTRGRRLESQYGITLADYKKMQKKQDNRCAICHRKEYRAWNGRVRDLCVDHDHDTGKVRQLLCSDCNTAIGMLQENEEVLLNAIKYLQKHRNIKLVA